MFKLIIICNIQNLNKALHQLLNSNKQEMFKDIGKSGGPWISDVEFTGISDRVMRKCLNKNIEKVVGVAM